MKKISTFSLLTALVLCGCQSKELEDCVVEPTNFTATIEDNFDNGSKTSLDNQGNVLWKKGDQISIFAGSTINEQYQVSDDSDGKTSAKLNKVSTSGFVAGSEINSNVAFYPYASSVSIFKKGTDYALNDIVLPSKQYYAEDSFGNGTFPMAAVSSSASDMQLKFKNITGGLKLQLKGTASIKSISITGNNGETLCGAAEVSVSNTSVPSISMTEESAKTVTLDCADGILLNSSTATSFVIALPPMTMTGGFTVVVSDTEGKQMKIKTDKSQTITRSSILKMPVVDYEGTAQEPLTFTSAGSNAIVLEKVGSPSDISLEYRLNDGDWIPYTIGASISLKDKEQLSFKAGAEGNLHFNKDSFNYYRFVISGNGTVAASGNIMSLADQTMSTLAIPDKYYFAMLFDDCASLTQAPELPAIIISDRCYNNMFYGCTSLTRAPELPATTLAYYCYFNMFYDCTSLIQAPELPATTLAERCYSAMFHGCTSLAQAPELPATTLARGCCVSMFSGCTSLTQAPDLHATTLASNCCSFMFYGCTSLTQAPELPATTLAERCYEEMFSGCSKLNYVKALFTTTPSDTYTEDWLSGVSPTGTFVKSKDATWDVTGGNGIPDGWTVQIAE